MGVTKVNNTFQLRPLHWLGAGLLALAALAMLTPAEPPASLEQQYPGPWRNDENQGLQSTLARAGANGCGQFWYRAAAHAPGEYLVYCLGTAEHWSAYQAWTHSGDIIGPRAIDPELPPPSR